MSSSKQQNAIVPVEPGDYAIAGISPEEIREIIGENLGGGAVNTFDFQRVKVPSGGMCAWEVPTLEGPKIEKEVQGIIVYWRDARSMWRLELGQGGGGGAPPDCVGAMVPTGSVGQKQWVGRGVRWEGDDAGPRECAICPYQEFGSSEKGGGKKCKEMRLLAILTPESILPLILLVPPSSLGAIRSYFLGLAGQRQRYYGVVTGLSLTEAHNQGGIKYAEVNPRLIAPLPVEIQATVRAYSDSLKPVLERVDAATSSPGSAFAEDNLEDVSADDDDFASE